MLENTTLRIILYKKTLDCDVQMYDENKGVSLTDCSGVTIGFDEDVSIIKITAEAFNKLVKQAGFEKKESI